MITRAWAPRSRGCRGPGPRAGPPACRPLAAPVHRPQTRARRGLRRSSPRVRRWLSHPQALAPASACRSPPSTFWPAAAPRSRRPREPRPRPSRPPPAPCQRDAERTRRRRRADCRSSPTTRVGGGSHRATRSRWCCARPGGVTQRRPWRSPRPWAHVQPTTSTRGNVDVNLRRLAQRNAPGRAPVGSGRGAGCCERGVCRQRQDRAALVTPAPSSAVTLAPRTATAARTRAAAVRFMGGAFHSGGQHEALVTLGRGGGGALRGAASIQLVIPESQRNESWVISV